MPFGGSIKLTGESEYRRAIQNITRDLNTMSTSLKEQATQFTANNRDLKNNATEQGKLSEAVKAQKAEVERAKNALSQYSVALEGQKAKHQALTREYKSAVLELEKVKRASGETSEEYKKQEQVVENLGNQLADSTREMDASKNAMASLKSEIKNAQGTIDSTEKSVDELGNEVEDAGEQAEKSSSGWSVFKGILVDLASNVIMSAISGLKNMAQETLNVGMGFEAAMSKVAAISGATGEDLELLTAKAKEMGEKTQFSATESAEAFNYMAMAGWKTEDMIGGIEGIMNLAAASGEDLATTSDIVTDALTAMGYSANDAGRLADVMAAASSNANTNVGMMGETFKYAAPIAGALGYSMEDTAVAIGLMANSGIKASQAGTSLRSILTRLSAPPKEAAEAMEELGISITNADGTMKPMSTVIEELRGKFDGLSAAQQTEYAKSLAGQEAMSGLLAIVNAAPEDYEKLVSAVNTAGGSVESFGEQLGASGTSLETLQKEFADAGVSTEDFNAIFAESRGSADAFVEGLDEACDGGYRAKDILDKLGLSNEDLQSAFDNSTGAAERMAGTMIDNAEGGMTLLHSKIEGIQIELYDKFKPAIETAIEVLNDLADGFKWLIDHGGEIVGILTGIGVAVGTYVAYTTAMKIMTEGWRSLTIVTKAQSAAQAVLNAVMSMNPIGLVVAAIAGLVAAFVVLWNKSEGFRNFWIGLWENIKAVAEPIAEWFSETWHSIVDWFTEAWETVKEKFSGVWESIKEVFGTIAQWVDENVFQPLMQFFEPVITFFTEAWEIIGQLAEGCWELIKRVWEVVSGWFDENIIQPVSNFFKDLWEKISNAGKEAWEAIKGVWDAVSGWFNEKIISPVKNFFKDMWDGLKNGAKDAWTGIKKVFSPVINWFKDKFSKAWKAVKNVFSTGGKVFDGIKEGITSAFKSVVNAIIRGINRVISIPFNAINNTLDKIRDVEVLGIAPFKNLISRFNVPQIPELARGGILKRGQIGLLEGNGTEAVVPLEQNTQWTRRVASQISEQLGTSQIDRSGTDFDKMVSAFKSALSQVKIELDDDEVGSFVDKTVTRLVYS